MNSAEATKYSIRGRTRQTNAVDVLYAVTTNDWEAAIEDRLFKG